MDEDRLNIRLIYTMNFLTTNPSHGLKNLRFQIAPTGINFDVYRSNIGVTQWTFTMTPSVTTWLIVEYTLLFLNNSESVLYTIIKPYNGGNVYTHASTSLDTYTFKIRVKVKYQHYYTGQVLNFTSTYYKQPTLWT